MTSKPCEGRSRSRMICGRRRLHTYEQTVNLNPGYTSSVTAAPPRTCRRSRTTTFLPAWARYAAVVRPLWPPPMTMASYPRATMPTSFKARRVGNTQEARRAARGNGGGVISFIRGPRPPGGGSVRRGSPFHSRTSALCDSWEWRGWSGYLAASSYSLVPEMEYYAIRHSAGLLDVSPLYKYLISGKDALPLVNKVVTRDASKLAKGQIYYTPWCDERGKTVDDGTLWNFGDGSFRMTSAEPNLKWLQDARIGGGPVLAEVESRPWRKAVIDGKMCSPLELSLDWTVAGSKGPFIGRKALLEEGRRGPARRTVGLEIDWQTVERFYWDMGLPPQPPAEPWREKGPLYSGYRQIGWATSRCWSPPRTSRRRASRCWSSNVAPSWAAHASRRKFIPGSAPQRSRTHAASCGLKSRRTSTSRRSAWRSTSTILPSSSPSRTGGSCSIGTTRIGIGSRWRSSRRRTPRPGPGTRGLGTSSRT